MSRIGRVISNHGGWVALLGCLVAVVVSARPAEAGTTTWTGGGNGLSIGPNGTVVTTDFTRNLVQRFSPDGTLISQWGTSGTGPGQIQGPSDVASAPNGDVYVLEYRGTRVQHFTGDGTFLGQIGVGEVSSVTCIPDAVRGAGAVAVAPDGTVLVEDNDCSTGQQRIRRFDPALGTVLGTFHIPANVHGMTVAPTGDIYLTDSQSAVRRLSASGTEISSWTDQNAIDVGVDRSGSVFVMVTGGRIDKFSADGVSQGSFTLPPEARGGGSLAASEIVVYAGSSAGTRITRIDPSTPTAALAVTPNPGTQGASITLDASGSSVPFSAPTRFEWDTDGDGSFESDTGSTTTRSVVYPTRRNLDVSVRVTAPSGATDIATIPVVVGPPGVSVNAGAQFTNDPHVTVSVVWPLNATDFLLSNDGGFTPASHFNVAPKVPWTLDSSGPERLPKTVYVRFAGGSAGNETYQDDIILDQTPPVIQRVLVAPSTSPGGRKAGAARHRRTASSAFRISINASDNLSGVSALQIARNTRVAVRDRKFTRSLLYRGKLPVYIRARDHAGNYSKWTKATLRKRTKTKRRAAHR